MNNKAKYFCIFFLLFFIQSPVFATSYTYNTNRIYSFNQSWVNMTPNENLTACNFTLVRPDNTIKIYDLITSPINVSNNSSTFPVLCAINFTQDQLGPAGNYSYNWSAKNDTEWKTIGPFDFTVEQANPSFNMNISINGSQSDLLTLYPNTTNVTAWETNEGDGNCIYNLYRDGELVEGNNETILLGVGNYTYIYNTSGCENYTNAFIVRVLNITPGVVPIHLYLNGTEGNKTDNESYEFNDIANFSALLNTTGVPYELANKTIYLDSNFPYWILQNSNNSIFLNYTINLNFTGLFNLTAYWLSDNENYTDSHKTYFFGVTPYWIENIATPSSGSTYEPNKDYSFQIRWIGNISEVRFEADFNGTMLNYTNNTNISVSNWNKNISVNNDANGNYWINFTDLPANTYNYRWYANDTSYGWFSTVQFEYVINQIPVSLNWASPSYWTVDTETTVTVTCNANVSINLTLTIVGFPSVYSASLGSVSTDISSETAITYTISCLPTDNVNYSGYITRQLTFQASPDTGTPSSPGTETPTTGTFTIENLVSNIYVNASESKSITFDLKNTFTNTLVNITISLTGIDSSWYSISKIDKVLHGTSESVTITFNIPEDASGNYTITVKAEGKDILSGITKTTPSKTLTLTINPKPEEVIEEVVTTPENVTANITEEAPTGFIPLVSEYFSYLVLLIGVIASILIFVKRDVITYNLMKFSGRKVPKKLKKKIFKLPFLKDFKKAKMKKRRPKELEREIERDIKELRDLIEAEKKLKKRRK